MTSAVIYLCIVFVCCEKVGDSVRNAVKICGFSLLPSLFPFMILSSFVSLTDLKYEFSNIFGVAGEKLFHCPKKYTHILFLSLIGGYPIGANMINSDLEKGEMNISEAEKLLCFCVNCSPAFIISGVGLGILGDIKAGVIIWISEVLSCIITACFTHMKTDSSCIPNPKDTIPYCQALVKSINNSAISMLCIFGFVIGFSAFTAVLSNNRFFMKIIDFCYNIFFKKILPYNYFETLIFGMIEISGGIFRINQGLIQYMSLFSFLTAFGGIGVFFQIKNCIKMKINFKPFIISRFAMGIYSALFTEIFKRYFLKTSVYAMGNIGAEAYINSNSIIYTLCMLSMIITILLKKEEVF